MLDRLGLGPVAGSVGSGESELSFAGTAMALLSDIDGQSQFNKQTGRAPAQAIGGAALTDPQPTGLLALRLMHASSDPATRLLQVQRLCVAAAMIGEACGAVRLYWPAAALWSPVAALANAVAALEREGLPPILHLVAFTSGVDVVQTRGLAHFCNVELQLQAPSNLPLTEAVRRLARLAIHAMIVGPLEPGAAIAGLERHERLIVGAALKDSDPPVLPVRMLVGR